MSSHVTFAQLPLPVLSSDEATRDVERLAALIHRDAVDRPAVEQLPHDRGTPLSKALARRTAARRSSSRRSCAGCRSPCRCEGALVSNDGCRMNVVSSVLEYVYRHQRPAIPCENRLSIFICSALYQDSPSPDRWVIVGMFGATRNTGRRGSRAPGARQRHVDVAAAEDVRAARARRSSRRPPTPTAADAGRRR